MARQKDERVQLQFNGTIDAIIVLHEFVTEFLYVRCHGMLMRKAVGQFDDLFQHGRYAMRKKGDGIGE